MLCLYSVTAVILISVSCLLALGILLHHSCYSRYNMSGIYSPAADWSMATTGPQPRVFTQADHEVASSMYQVLALVYVDSSLCLPWVRLQL